jgi:hypothetical protein
MEALRSSETSVLTRAKRRNIPEDHSSVYLSFHITQICIVDKALLVDKDSMIPSSWCAEDGFAIFNPKLQQFHD